MSYVNGDCILMFIVPNGKTCNYGIYNNTYMDQFEGFNKDRNVSYDTIIIPEITLYSDAYNTKEVTVFCHLR